ncbi:hypothetical protein DPMN_020913 [Dreissena polymorpha]|uniref:Uncharacterized protein n=1 Tax=Dreissena polymorpha TaxID=45954 RepID=A0A9D4NHP2_DREPO|nr:hypothetical protein DPMN_020913 [Dreissena polymorpha]
MSSSLRLNLLLAKCSPIFTILLWKQIENQVGSNKNTVCGGISIYSYIKFDIRYLQGNRLRNISRATFRGLAKLRFLYLSSNQLESIDDGAFAGMPDLYELKCIWRDFPSFISRIIIVALVAMMMVIAAVEVEALVAWVLVVSMVAWDAW